MGRINEDLKQAVLHRLAGRNVVLVGLMGCGKSTVGRRLANALDLPFKDADTEIELAACKSIPEIFEDHGEPYFRDGERRVIRRLLSGPQLVLATGGGAFMDPRTRAKIKERSVSLWLKADLGVLMQRVSRRDSRPLLRKGNPRATMERLMAEREPLYRTADVTVTSSEASHESVVLAALRALRDEDSVSNPGTMAARTSVG